MRATSSKTGIVHVFDSLKGLEGLARTFERKNYEGRVVDLINALSFWNGINAASPPPFQADVIWGQEFFRVCWGNYNPLSIAGSLAAGGRFNVGGAQLHSELPDIRMQGCLYGASTQACALAETGPAQGSRMYRILPREPLTLWDLDRVIRHYARPGLDDQVKASPMNAEWVMQKVPRVPQLLAHFLRARGGNGLIYHSTKDTTGGQVLAFFINTDEETQRLFISEELFKGSELQKVPTHE